MPAAAGTLPAVFRPSRQPARTAIPDHATASHSPPSTFAATQPITKNTAAITVNSTRPGSAARASAPIWSTITSSSRNATPTSTRRRMLGPPVAHAPGPSPPTSPTSPAPHPLQHRHRPHHQHGGRTPAHPRGYATPPAWRPRSAPPPGRHPTGVPARRGSPGPAHKPPRPGHITPQGFDDRDATLALHRTDEVPGRPAGVNDNRSWRRVPGLLQPADQPPRVGWEPRQDRK